MVFYMGAYGVGVRFATSDRWWPKAWYCTWGPMAWESGLRPLTCGGRKRRNLHGSLSLVAERVVIYMGAYGWGSGLRPLTGGGRKCGNLHGILSLVAESVGFPAKTVADCPKVSYCTWKPMWEWSCLRKPAV